MSDRLTRQQTSHLPHKQSGANPSNVGARFRECKVQPQREILGQEEHYFTWNSVAT